MPTVNERFRDIRKELGFNQQQFAYELGISQTWPMKIFLFT